MRNFDEQQIFQLKTTINHANERDLLFQSQNNILSVQFSNKTHIDAKDINHLCNSFEIEYRLTSTNLQCLHQHHLQTT